MAPGGVIEGGESRRGVGVLCSGGGYNGAGVYGWWVSGWTRAKCYSQDSLLWTCWLRTLGYFFGRQHPILYLLDFDSSFEEKINYNAKNLYDH